MVIGKYLQSENNPNIKIRAASVLEREGIANEPLVGANHLAALSDERLLLQRKGSDGHLRQDMSQMRKDRKDANPQI